MGVDADRMAAEPDQRADDAAVRILHSQDAAQRDRSRRTPVGASPGGRVNTALVRPSLRVSTFRVAASASGIVNAIFD